jgi:hypothetical protein
MYRVPTQARLQRTEEQIAEDTFYVGSMQGVAVSSLWESPANSPKNSGPTFYSPGISAVKQNHNDSGHNSSAHSTPEKAFKVRAKLNKPSVLFSMESLTLSKPLDTSHEIGVTRTLSNSKISPSSSYERMPTIAGQMKKPQIPTVVLAARALSNLAVNLEAGIVTPGEAQASAASSQCPSANSSYESLQFKMDSPFPSPPTTPKLNRA